MKHLIVLALAFILIIQLNAQQEGKIIYKETIKLDVEFDGMDESMKAMIPKSQSIDKELLFTKSESLFQNKKGESREDLNLSSDDGSFQIKIQTDDTENILYKSFTKKQQIHQKGIMGKSFVVKDQLTKNQWKITNEKIKYLDYECQKAVIENEDNFIVAWFTTEIPVQAGPAGLHGLPGAILMATYNDGERELKAQNIEFIKLDSGAISIPKNGIKVTEAEFKKIREEKDKEMEAMYGNGHIRRTRG